MSEVAFCHPALISIVFFLGNALWFQEFFLNKLNNIPAQSDKGFYKLNLLSNKPTIKVIYF
ncbi:MAG: hypothetical protein CVU42_08555 [Chloroflexi bacterium HGW-Chloroflexi-4]|jgi:hypothetical protein|nr:MAG: hypothetical protein CVU42_08555 [Chloroflexi bacterium HGW-Chloroflexi-4]